MYVCSSVPRRGPEAGNYKLYRHNKTTDKRRRGISEISRLSVALSWGTGHEGDASHTVSFYQEAGAVFSTASCVS